MERQFQNATLPFGMVPKMGVQQPMYSFVILLKIYLLAAIFQLPHQRNLDLADFYLAVAFFQNDPLAISTFGVLMVGRDIG